jgi:hypothetical protein
LISLTADTWLERLLASGPIRVDALREIAAHDGVPFRDVVSASKRFKARGYRTAEELMKADGTRKTITRGWLTKG